VTHRQTDNATPKLPRGAELQQSVPPHLGIVDHRHTVRRWNPLRRRGTEETLERWLTEEQVPSRSNIDNVLTNITENVNYNM